MQTEAQKKATERYRRANVRQVSVAFFPQDADLFEWLQEQDGKAAYIRSLIRKDMERQRGEAPRDEDHAS